MGEWSGNLNLLRNDGTLLVPLFVLVDEDYGGIDIGNNSAPRFVDIDDDGDEDLFVGELLGNINFYRNTGTSQSAVFELDTTSYFGIDAGTYSTLWFSDIDDDNDSDLFVGSDDQGVSFYRNQGDSGNAIFVPDTLTSLPFHYRTAPVLVDVDGDQDMDMICGVAGGGAVFYRSEKMVSSMSSQSNPDSHPQTLAIVRSYPNPFNSETSIVFDLARDTRVSIQVHDLTGRVIKDLADREFRRGRNEVRWRVDEKASGVYFCRIRGAGVHATLKLLLMR